MGKSSIQPRRTSSSGASGRWSPNLPNHLCQGGASLVLEVVVAVQSDSGQTGGSGARIRFTAAKGSEYRVNCQVCILLSLI